MATTPAPLPQAPSGALSALRAVAFALLASVSGTALADDLAAIEKQLRRGEAAQALERLDTHLRDAPDDTRARFLKGVALSETGRDDEAIAAFTKLTEDHPELPEPYNNLAVLYAQKGLYERARQALDMALQAFPSYALAWENLGDLHVKLAGQAYEKAGQLDARNRNAARKLSLTRELLAAPAKAAPAAATPKQ
ncbi:MAG: tetratricopeptide repeat protein [Betaproteobacteria bacterium]|nr:tetratricopeptide repeat protein [Betaproteobacteria bacterium]